MSGLEHCQEAAREHPGPGRGEGSAECVDCGHEFWFDSSPHFDRCWQCAERADAEFAASRGES